MADEKQPAAPAKPDFYLVVIHPFGDYRRGDPISDAGEIAAVMEGDCRHHCHKIFAQ
jgi:hypothetical protein